MSRKFWVTVFGVLTSLGLWGGSDIQTDKLIEVITYLLSAYMIGTGIESGLQAIGKAESKTATHVPDPENPNPWD